MRIAILYICTGKYEMFWEPFYQSCQEHFYTEHEIEYFVFTDSPKILESKNEKVHPYFQRRAGWPYDTLLRFQWFSSVQDRLKEYDFCYYLNANTAFKMDVTQNMIPFPTKENPLIFWCHSNYYNDYTGASFNPERNPKSTAYVPEDCNCRCYGGGFFGGTSSAFIKMCIELRDAIQKDINNGIIAIWHDQSHVIRYAIDHDHLEVPQGIMSEEEYIPDIDKCAVVFLAKSNYGGNDALRDVDLKVRISHLPRKSYTKMLSIVKGTVFEKALRKVVRCAKGKNKL